MDSVANCLVWNFAFVCCVLFVCVLVFVFVVVVQCGRREMLNQISLVLILAGLMEDLQNSAVSLAIVSAHALFFPFSKNENRCSLLQRAKKEERPLTKSPSKKVQLPICSLVLIPGVYLQYISLLSSLKLGLLTCLAFL